MSKVRKENTNRKTIARIVLGIILLAAVVISIIEYREMQKFETTDDAQVEGDIVPVISRAPGYIAEIRFKENQSVSKGDTLVLLDAQELKIKVNQVQAAMQNALATLDVAKSNAIAAQVGVSTVQSKIDELKIRLSYAQTELKRYNNLLINNATTQQQYDKVKTDEESIEKQLQAAMDQLNETQKKNQSINEQIKVAQSMISQRKNDLDFAQLQLSYTYVLAPESGVVSKKNIQLGQVVQPSQSLCAIVTENRWIVANFKETQLAKMKVGQSVTIEADAFKGSISAKVESFSEATGSKFSLLPPDNASGNFVKVVQRIPVRIELDKTNELYRRLKPGMSIYVKVNLNS